jgi:hypothetical protein
MDETFAEDYSEETTDETFAEDADGESGEM